MKFISGKEFLLLDEWVVISVSEVGEESLLTHVLRLDLEVDLHCLWKTQ